MNILENVSNQIVPLPLWLVFIILLLFGGIVWGFQKFTGFQLIYIFTLSMCIAYIVIAYFPLLSISQERIPFSQPGLQAITVFTYYFVQGNMGRQRLFIYISTPIIIGLLLYFFLDVHLVTVFNSIVIGSFIIFTLRRSQDWIGGMPEPQLIVLTLVLPFMSLLVIYPMSEGLFYSGILLGSGLGFIMELLKVRLTYLSVSANKKAISLLLGTAGLVILFLGQPFFQIIPLGSFIHGTLIGLWICLIVPFLQVSLHLNPSQAK